MLPGNKGRGVDLAVIADLGRTRIALEQERLRPGAGGAQRREEQCKKELTRSGAIIVAQSEAAFIKDWIS